VIQLASSSVSVIVTPGLPVKSMREFIELARREPGKLNYFFSGDGAPQHLAMELLKLDAHLDLVHVPYKGSGGAPGRSCRRARSGDDRFAADGGALCPERQASHAGGE